MEKVMTKNETFSAGGAKIKGSGNGLAPKLVALLFEFSWLFHAPVAAKSSSFFTTMASV